MHETIKPHSAHLAEAQARRAPTVDERFAALENAQTRTMLAVEALARKDSARRYDDDRRDDDRARDDEMKRLRDDNARMRKELDDRAKKDARDTLFGKRKDMKQAEDADVEEEREEAEEQHEKDDDKRDDDNEGEPEEMASDDDRRYDARADATVRSLKREMEELRRGMKRVITDEDMNKLAEKQSEWDKVAQLHGHRASRPLDGERVASYDRRMAKVYQKHSAKWAGQDLSALPIEVVTKIAAPEIRADSTAHAYKPHAADGGMQREVRRQDQAGRWISEFVGPVNAVNGALAPFRMQPYRCRVNPDPSKYS